MEIIGPCQTTRLNLGMSHGADLLSITPFLAFHIWLDTLLRWLLCKEWPLVLEMQQRGNSIKIPCTHSLFLFLFIQCIFPICGPVLGSPSCPPKPQVPIEGNTAGKICCRHHIRGFTLCLWLVSRSVTIHCGYVSGQSLDDQFSQLFIWILEFWVCNIEYCAAGVSGICYEQWHIPLEYWVGTAGAPLNRQPIVYQWSPTANREALDVDWKMVVKKTTHNLPKQPLILNSVCSHLSVIIMCKGVYVGPPHTKIYEFLNSLRIVYLLTLYNMGALICINSCLTKA